VEQYVLYACGGFATELAEYLKETGDALRAQNSGIEVSDIVDAERGRYDEVCAILGQQPKLHGGLESLADTGHKRVLVCIGDPAVRERVYQKCEAAGLKFGTLVHPTAWVAPSARIGAGVIICPFAFVGPHADIGANCVVNVRATIAHDVRLGRSVVVSPHADLNGGSACGAVSLVGAGAIVDPGRKVGRFAKIASGSVVKQDMGDGFLATGNPAKGRQMFKVPEIA